MSKIVVVYKSRYGSSAKYADWIAEDLKADLLKSAQASVSKLRKYDTIVYCGGLYIGGIPGFSRIKRNYKKLKDKNIVVVAVGATQKKDSAIEEVKNKNLLPEMEQNNVRFFLLRGALDYTKMRLTDRFLMFLLVRSIKSKDPETLDSDAKGILSTYGKTVDFTDKKSIQPVINAVKR